jgi:lycopene cyclase domain-containing protein
MERWLYLSLILFTVIVPLIRSFEPRIHFVGKWKAFFPAMLLVGLCFVLWDIQFTSMGVWGFNPRYLSGLYISNLPIEEVLFFVVIPYASIFVLEVLDYFFKNDLGDSTNRIWAFLLGAINLTVAFSFRDLLYTFWSQLVNGLLLVLVAAFRPAYLRGFLRMFALILIGFFIVNGLLTGSFIEEEVVWYSAEEFYGIRLGTIPFEDVFYGMSLILANAVLYKILKQRLGVA